MPISALAVPILAVVLGSAPAAAPVVVIEHQGPVAVEDGAALEAKMVSTIGKKIFAPAAFVRPLGGAEFTRLPMTPLPDDHFRAPLPPALATKECEYFLEAFDEDGNGPFRKGGPDRPIRLTKPTASLPGVAPRPTPAPAHPAAQVAETADRGRPLRTGGIALLAGGGALLAAGGISGALALKDYNSERAATNLAAYESARSAAKVEALAADVLLGAGAVAAIVGIILWANDPNPAPPSAKPVKFSAAPIAGGACAVLSGRF
ncbi:MAG TPA: hypothetical protein VGK67_24220 [Myxococcales bacterium]|jgi:hypothetical protein